MKSSFFHAQHHFPGLGGGGAGPYLPGQAQVDIHIQEEVSVSPDFPQTQQLHQQPIQKLPVYQFIIFSHASPKNLI